MYLTAQSWVCQLATLGSSFQHAPRLLVIIHTHTTSRGYGQAPLLVLVDQIHHNNCVHACIFTFDQSGHGCASWRGASCSPGQQGIPCCMHCCVTPQRKSMPDHPCMAAVSYRAQQLCLQLKSGSTVPFPRMLAKPLLSSAPVLCGSAPEMSCQGTTLTRQPLADMKTGDELSPPAARRTRTGTRAEQSPSPHLPLHARLAICCPASVRCAQAGTRGTHY